MMTIGLRFARLLLATALMHLPATARAQIASFLGSAPQVETISTAELQQLVGQWLKKQQAQPDTERLLGEQQDIVLVDVRSEEEFNVSIIPGAITKAQFSEKPDKYQGKTVIVYCTVGGRSARYAAELAKSGVAVKNYKGSILEWVQAQQPLRTLDGQETRQVHLHSNRYQVPAGYEAVAQE